MAFLFRAYSRVLNDRPFLTTSLSSAFCYSIGDLLAQQIEIKQNKKSSVEFRRTFLMGAFGMGIAGPLYCAWFQKIHHINKLFETLVKWNYERQLKGKLVNTFTKHIKDNKITNMSMKDFVKSNENEFNRLNNEVVFRSKTILAGQVYADQFIFSLIYPVIFMMSTGLMLDNISPEHWKYIKENKKFNFEMMKSSFDKNWENVKNKYLTIYMTDCAVWPLIQIGNFAFVPAIYQPIFVNFVNIFWNAFLCYVSQGH